MLPGHLRSSALLLVTLWLLSADAATITASFAASAGRPHARISANESELDPDVVGHVVPSSARLVSASLPSAAAAASWQSLLGPCFDWWETFFGEAREASAAAGSDLMLLLEQVPAVVAAQPPQVPGKSPMPWDKDRPSELQVVISVLIWAILVVLVASRYVESKQPPVVGLRKQGDEEDPDDWEFSPFSCFDDPGVAMLAMFCPGIRWAETLSYVPGFIPFWSAFGIYLFIQIFSGLTAGTLGWILLALLCTAYRQELRIKFGLHEQGGWTYVVDCLLYCCCSCCAIAQEARHVKEARRRGHPAAARLSGVDGIAPGLQVFGLLTARDASCMPGPAREV